MPTLSDDPSSPLHGGLPICLLAAIAAAVVLKRSTFGVRLRAVGLNELAARRAGISCDALLIAVIGLGVNIVSAFILKDGHHDHDHGHHHAQSQDNNSRAAYVHVLADAATSVAAIMALAGAWWWGLSFLDPLCGLLGAVVIGVWAFGLVRDSALVLLDAESDPHLARDIRALIETELGARVADMHLWRLGPGHQGLIVSLISKSVTDAETIKAALRARHPGLSHVTVEVAICADCP